MDVISLKRGEYGPKDLYPQGKPLLPLKAQLPFLQKIEEAQLPSLTGRNAMPDLDRKFKRLEIGYKEIGRHLLTGIQTSSASYWLSGPEIALAMGSFHTTTKFLNSAKDRETKLYEACRDQCIRVLQLAQGRVVAMAGALKKIERKIDKRCQQNEGLKSEMKSLWIPKELQNTTEETLIQALLNIRSQFGEDDWKGEYHTEGYRQLTTLINELKQCQQERSGQRRCFNQAATTIHSLAKELEQQRVPLLLSDLVREEILAAVCQLPRSLYEARPYDLPFLTTHCAFSMDRLQQALRAEAFPEGLEEFWKPLIRGYRQTLKEQIGQGHNLERELNGAVNYLERTVELVHGQTAEEGVLQLITSGARSQLGLDLPNTEEKLKPVFACLLALYFFNYPAALFFSAALIVANRLWMPSIRPHLPNYFIDVPTIVRELALSTKKLEPQIGSSLSTWFGTYKQGVEALAERQQVYNEGASCLLKLSRLQSALKDLKGAFQRIEGKNCDEWLAQIKGKIREYHPIIVGSHSSSITLDNNLQDVDHLKQQHEGLRKAHERYRKRFEELASAPVLWEVKGHEFVISYHKSNACFTIQDPQTQHLQLIQ
ncbi:MAG: hypothetical protein AB7F31_03925 [Parachlamydiales bacterium]